MINHIKLHPFISRKNQPLGEIPPPVYCYTDIIDVRSSSQFDATTGPRSGLYRRYVTIHSLVLPVLNFDQIYFMAKTKKSIYPQHLPNLQIILNALARYDLSEYVSALLFNNASFKPQTVDVHFGKTHSISTFSFLTSKSGFGINDGPSKFILQVMHWRMKMTSILID